jgi:4-carboxymuconolactone decarboxylase
MNERSQVVYEGMLMAGERTELGRRTCEDVMGWPAPTSDLPLDVAGVDFLFAEVWARPGLSRRDRRFVTLGCVAAAGVPGPMAAHIAAALRSGDVSVEEMREAVLHFAVYGGWPKAATFNQSVEEQIASFASETGANVDAAPLLPLATANDPEARLAGGEAMFREVNVLPFTPPRDNPFTGAGVVNFVFGELWHRPGLARRERRLISLPVAAYSTSGMPLIAHVYGAIASGDLSIEEVDELVLHFAVYAGWPKGAGLHAVVAEQKAKWLQEQQGGDA